MLLSDLISKLQKIQEEHGNCHIGRLVSKFDLRSDPMPGDPTVFKQWTGVDTIPKDVPGYVKPLVRVVLVHLW